MSYIKNKKYLCNGSRDASIKHCFSYLVIFLFKIIYCAWYFLHLTQSLKDITLELYIFSNEMINQDSNLQRKIIRKGKYSMTCNHVFDWTQNNSVVAQLVERSIHMWEIRVRSPCCYGQLNLLKQVHSDSSTAKQLAIGVRVTRPQKWP